MKSTGSRVFATTTITAGAAALTYAMYRKDLEAARERIELERQNIEPSIEFAEAGDGPAVLMIHGAGGGFDQGLDLGRTLLGDAYRIIAPSRFGYLGTPMPADPSPEAQSDAHLRVLDALQLETVPVIGVSAGAPSAMQLCLKHPDRCSALILVVPMTWAPERSVAKSPSRFFETVLNKVATSDFLFWTATKVARRTLLQTILGTPVADYTSAPADERRRVDLMLRSILPISRRVEGIRNDSVISSNLTCYALEDIRVPTLLISATNDLYGTYAGSLYTAHEIPNARFVGFRRGGHFLLGHTAEVRAQVTGYLAEHRARNRAIAV